MDEKEVILTQDGFDKLEKELEQYHGSSKYIKENPNN